MGFISELVECTVVFDLNLFDSLDHMIHVYLMSFRYSIRILCIFITVSLSKKSRIDLVVVISFLSRCGVTTGLWFYCIPCFALNWDWGNPELQS
jgi:hypothetical protein